MRNAKRTWNPTVFVVVTMILMVGAPAFADDIGSTGMPWETFLQDFVSSLRPIVTAAALIVGTMLGLTMAFGEGGSGFSKVMKAGFGLTIAIGTPTWLLPALGLAAGALI